MPKVDHHLDAYPGDRSPLASERRKPEPFRLSRGRWHWEQRGEAEVAARAAVADGRPDDAVLHPTRPECSEERGRKEG